MRRYRHRYHHKYTFPSIIILLIVAISILLFGVYNLHRSTNTTVPRGSNMSVLGIELDQTKDDVDLHKVQDNGVSFVYLRSTQGKTYFDDNFLLYRDQLQGTRLSWGSIVTYSNESTPLEQYQFFMKKVGQNSGNLPVMIVPAVDSQSKKYWRSLATFAQYLQSNGKKILVADNHHWKNLFLPETQFLYTGASLKNRKDYSFWCYTQNGRVKNTEYLEGGTTMFAYIGSMSNYQQLYDSNLTQ
ncbi:GH25 family lysozyme M1 (1,4-beta-N-acetylmuramidase) [Lactobacillus colini]|uniref:GH25 family lysozyme M1 (1,4-beta-N-acetylmuramidase) n=1 Tax=Lactobacillus colini TaxID=1819254 RepID=A0ABS4MD13_9LACO|nr:GH25 family lysozyme [Lactobacillus colini]MBP2057577.1 GH25 family lysozyme M1 (1,4-beta-N-acetylmuramidase) [Lactobacillus colini]